MSSQSPSPPDQWPPPWARAAAFMTGLGLIVYEATIDRSAHLAVYGIGLILTGLPVAGWVDFLASRGK